MVVLAHRLLCCCHLWSFWPTGCCVVSLVVALAHRLLCCLNCGRSGPQVVVLLSLVVVLAHRLLCCLTCGRSGPQVVVLLSLVVVLAHRSLCCVNCGCSGQQVFVPRHYGHSVQSAGVSNFRVTAEEHSEGFETAHFLPQRELLFVQFTNTLSHFPSPN